jgi:hypothetical protein
MMKTLAEDQRQIRRWEEAQRPPRKKLHGGMARRRSGGSGASHRSPNAQRLLTRHGVTPRLFRSMAAWHARRR